MFLMETLDLGGIYINKNPMYPKKIPNPGCSKVRGVGEVNSDRCWLGRNRV